MPTYEVIVNNAGSVSSPISVEARDDVDAAKKVFSNNFFEINDSNERDISFQVSNTETTSITRITGSTLKNFRP